jgi:hypothetical protein
MYGSALYIIRSVGGVGSPVSGEGSHIHSVAALH